MVRRRAWAVLAWLCERVCLTRASAWARAHSQPHYPDERW
jgi:hypothetical protein